MKQASTHEPMFFRDASAFRTWLGKNAGSASELVVGFYKVGSGKPSLTWPEAVDEALCVGWIDGVRRRIDDESYQIRFSPRRQRSVWSAVNIKRAEDLIATGRMKPAGLKAFEARIDHTSSIHSYEQKGELHLDPAELAQFRKNRSAWVWFEKAPAGYRRLMTYWIVSAKRPDTRAKRLQKLIDSCAAGVRLIP